MTQIRGYELKEAHMALERGGVVIDAEELSKLMKRVEVFQEIAMNYEKRVAKLEKALKKAQKMVKIAEGE